MKPALSTLFITWQEPESRRIFPIARLMGLAGGAYELAYIQAAVAAESVGFHGLPGYEDLKKVYVSAELPRLFENRLPARGRHAAAQDASELIGEGLDAAPITILVPLGDGTSERLEAFAPPLPTPAGAYAGAFWVRGVGRIAGSEDAALGLHSHQRVSLSPEPNNAYNPRALRVIRTDDVPIGYVPDYLANELSLAARPEPPLPELDPALIELEVLHSARANFPPAAPLYKVLCRYSCSAELGRRLFYSEAYEPLSNRAYRRAPPRA
jgi:hypothetical protein